MLFNILQSSPTRGSQTMLGCNVPFSVAETYLAKYRDGLPACNRGRVANGHPPLDVEYSIVEVKNGQFQPWLPEALRVSVH